MDPWTESLHTRVSSSSTKVLDGAIFGVAGYARQHLRFLRNAERDGLIRLRAALATGEERERDTIKDLLSSGCSVYYSTSQFFEDWTGKLDFCTLPTSISSHVPFMVQCLEAEMNVLVEKPLCADIDHLEKILSSLPSYPNRVVGVGFQDLFAPENSDIYEKIGNGYLGKVRDIRLLGAWPRGNDYFSRNDWAGKIRNNEGFIYDSPLNNAMAHFLNLCLYWASAGTKEEFDGIVDVEGNLYRAQMIDNFDTATVRLSLSNGIPISVWITHSSKEIIPPVVVIEGDRGTLTWKHGGEAYWKISDKYIPIQRTSETDSRKNMFQKFFESIGEKRNLMETSLRQAIFHVRAINFIQSNLTVSDVPADLLVSETIDGEQFTIIKGIEEILSHGFSERDLQISLRSHLLK